jgi:extracellular elastinolytic metalloproteinase
VKDGAGIRPVRYSTDMTINDYTYVHLPAAERGLSVPHGIGFVWSTILWDMYWELINKHGFDSDLYYGTGGNNIALQLVMDGLKLSTCSNVGFVDGRDAILAADAAIYDGENECLIRSVFARRGVGALAAQGTSESREDQVPDFSVNPIGLNACEERVLAIADENKTIFSVYPNPTADEIYINNSRNIGSAVYKIVDLNGRVIQTNTITLTNGSKINTSRLSSGMYILTLKTNSGEVFSQKIIKK